MNQFAKSSKDTAQRHFDAIIIGAGASGLFCASSLASFGKSVLVIDHANKAGKKILMSGGGRCNFINKNIEPRHFISQNPHFVKSALSGYGYDDFIKLVHQYKIAYQEKEHGQLFCQESSKDILNMLLGECQIYQVDIELDTVVEKIDRTDEKFAISVKQKHQNHAIFATSLIVATGGLSIPTMGATGFGYQVATQFGHQIVPTDASLVPFTFTDQTGEMIKSLAGISLPVIAYNDKISFQLPMLFTHRGLSGPAMLQLSNYWQLGESISINLLPTLNVSEHLLACKKKHPKTLIRTQLTPHFPKKLLSALEQYFWHDVQEIELANIKDDRLKQLGNDLNAWTLKPSGTEGYRVAEVTRGGVDTKDVSGKTMQSKLCPNLYFIGEVLDVTGWLGGYNFAWAWASAYACAKHIGSTW